MGGKHHLQLEYCDIAVSLFCTSVSQYRVGKKSMYAFLSVEWCTDVFTTLSELYTSHIKHLTRLIFSISLHYENLL